MAAQTEHVVMIGGGVGGLGAALALGPGRPPGHASSSAIRCRSTGDAEAAFAAERRGAPQVHQTHGFLARIVVRAARPLPRRARRAARRRRAPRCRPTPTSASPGPATRTCRCSSCGAPRSSGCCARPCWPRPTSPSAPARRSTGLVARPATTARPPTVARRRAGRRRHRRRPTSWSTPAGGAAPCPAWLARARRRRARDGARERAHVPLALVPAAARARRRARPEARRRPAAS